MRTAVTLPKVAVLLTAFVALAVPGLAKDVAGSTDHPLIGRYEGSTLSLYKTKDYEEENLLLRKVTGADMRANGGKRLNGANTMPVSGKSFRIKYDGPRGRSALEVARNLQGNLAAKGFSVLFDCRGNACSDMNGSELYFALNDESPMGRAELHAGPSDVAYTSAVLRRAEGDVYVGLYVGQHGDTPEILVDVVETKPMDTGKVVFIDASAMTKALGEHGRVALYGIQFDFDKADIKPESRPTLDEIAKLLKANARLSLVVAGHTDAKGAFDYNLALSQRRAAAVVADLVGTYGIDGSRLTPFGVGMASPIASNADEAGRTKNRRVELVER